MNASAGKFEMDDALQSSDHTAALSKIDEADSDSVRPEHSDSDSSGQSGAQQILLPSPTKLSDAFAVEISGASGPFSHIINGVFEVTSQRCCGMSVYRKRDDGDKWLEYSDQAVKWNVLDTAHRGQSWGWASFFSRCSIEECADTAGWKLFDGSKWADCPGMRLTLGTSDTTNADRMVDGSIVLIPQHLLGPQELLQQQQQQQKQQQQQQLQQSVPALLKRTSSVVMSHRLQHTRFASQNISPNSSPKLSPAQPPTQPPVRSLNESVSPTQAPAPSTPTVLKVHHENDNGVVVSHAIKYNQTSTAADVTSYVVRKMQLQPAAYELVFRSLESVGSDDAVFKCKNDVLLSNAVASCNGSRGKWWVRQYQLSYSEFKIEREWLRKELDEALEHQKEAFEGGQAAEARLREVVGRLEHVKAELRQSQMEKESFLLKNKNKAVLIGKFLDRMPGSGSHFQVI